MNGQIMSSQTVYLDSTITGLTVNPSLITGTGDHSQDGLTNFTLQYDNQTMAPPANETTTVNWMLLVLALIPISAIISNTLVCLAVKKYRPLQTNLFYILASLAGTHVLQAVVIGSPLLLRTVLGSFPLSDTVCQIWVVLDGLLSTATVFHLIAVTFDSYAAIKSPMTYRMHQTVQRVAVKLVAAWIFAVVLSLPLAIALLLTPPSPAQHFQGCGPFSTKHGLVKVCANFLLPCLSFIVAAVVSLRVINSVKKMSQTVKQYVDKIRAEMNRMKTPLGGEISSDGSTLVSNHDSENLPCDHVESSKDSSSESGSSRTGKEKLNLPLNVAEIELALSNGEGIDNPGFQHDREESLSDSIRRGHGSFKRSGNENSQQGKETMSKTKTCKPNKSTVTKPEKPQAGNEVARKTMVSDDNSVTIHAEPVVNSKLDSVSQIHDLKQNALSDNSALAEVHTETGKENSKATEVDRPSIHESSQSEEIQVETTVKPAEAKDIQSSLQVDQSEAPSKKIPNGQVMTGILPAYQEITDIAAEKQDIDASSEIRHDENTGGEPSVNTCEQVNNDPEGGNNGCSQINDLKREPSTDTAKRDENDPEDNDPGNSDNIGKKESPEKEKSDTNVNVASEEGTKDEEKEHTAEEANSSTKEKIAKSELRETAEEANSSTKEKIAKSELRETAEEANSSTKEKIAESEFKETVGTGNHDYHSKDYQDTNKETKPNIIGDTELDKTGQPTTGDQPEDVPAGSCDINEMQTGDDPLNSSMEKLVPTGSAPEMESLAPSPNMEGISQTCISTDTESINSNNLSRQTTKKRKKSVRFKTSDGKVLQPAISNGSVSEVPEEQATMQSQDLGKNQEKGKTALPGSHTRISKYDRRESMRTKQIQTNVLPDDPFEYVAQIHHAQSLRLSLRTAHYMETLRLLVVVFVMYMCLSLPSVLSLIIRSVCVSCTEYINPVVVVATDWLALCITIVNPFIYMIFVRHFRQALRQWWHST